MANKKGFNYYTQEEIDENFGERIFQKWNDANGLTLPVGNYVHRFSIFYKFSTASSNGNLALNASNYPFTGTTWVRRLYNESSYSSAEDSYSDGSFFLLAAPGWQATTNSGTLFASGEIIVSGTDVRAKMDYHASGFRGSGTTTVEAHLSSADQEITLAPIRANGTVSSVIGMVESIKLD